MLKSWFYTYIIGIYLYTIYIYIYLYYIGGWENRQSIFIGNYMQYIPSMLGIWDDKKSTMLLTMAQMLYGARNMLKYGL